MIKLKTPDDIARMRVSAGVVAEALGMVQELAIPGVTTAELDTRIERFIRDAGGVPAFLGYNGFPASSCISLNEEVVHGIPAPDRVLRDGDIVGVDIGVKLGGFFGDSARTFAVGSVPQDVQNLLRITRESLESGIAEARVGNRVGHISAAIQKHAEAAGYSIVRSLVGHGLGRDLHEEPAVPNFGKPGDGPVLEPGMVLAIEPMVNMGGRDVRTLDDGWTIVTADGSLSAHFEHSVAIQEDGPEILSVAGAGGRAAQGRG